MTFEYEIIVECYIDGRSFEFHKDYASPVQHRSGELVWIDGLESVKIQEVCWFLDQTGLAQLLIEDQYLAGPLSDWVSLLEFFDYSAPDIAAKARQSPEGSSAAP